MYPLLLPVPFLGFLPSRCLEDCLPASRAVPYPYEGITRAATAEGTGAREEGRLCTHVSVYYK